MSSQKNISLLLSPFIIIGIGFLTATFFSQYIDGWVWIPLAVVYWSSMGICIILFKGDRPIKSWLGKSNTSKSWITISLIVGMFPLSILLMNYQLFDSALLLILWLLFAFINPWFEELYWRGVLLDGLKKDWSKWFSIVYSTLFFVLSHPFMWGVFSIASKSYHLYIYLSLAGIVWAITYFKTKSLRWVIFSHFIVDIGNLTVLTFLNIYLPPTM